ncbi:terminase large subunit [Methylocystis heyeri]|uniref:Terminase large subunit n=1 Tax=Methylocystis heyeri TaxID=391905 RepID=A0A6B8KJC2_9HYPH|nr:terminase TerL endonuclease subunit [Methylocystis heyeri]QGM46663.1 terminase large subunit [Methylocystis heyeri]
MSKDTYPHWVFDDSPIPDPFGYGERAVEFIRSLKHPKSRLEKHAFQLDPWQERIVRRIYGPCDEFRNRIVNDVTILIPRGNRKTSLGAVLSILHTLGPETVPNSEVLFAAKDQIQAKIALREVEGIIRAGGILWQKGQGNRKFDAPSMVRLQDYLNRVLFPGESYIEAISSDAASAHGRTPVFALCDEIHAWPKRDIWDVIDTGLSKTPGSLRVTLTTSGRGEENIGYQVVNHARRIARGEIDEPNHLVILFETSPEANWEDEDVWKRVNPGFKHGYPDIVRMRQRAATARKRPADRDAFKMYHLNMWLDNSASPFVDHEVYDKGNKLIDLDALEKAPCWLGVDLSSTSDLTVIVAAWKDGEDGYIVHPWFFCPGDNLYKRQEETGVPYVQWAEEGLIEATPGNVVDIRTVERRIRELCDRFDVREIAFDPHLARITMSNLLEDGYPAVEFRQGWVSMAPAIKELEKAILGGKFTHGGHPILRWNFLNIVTQKDQAGNITFSKAKASEKIDGAVASAMAVSRASLGEDHRSIYATEARPDGIMVW